MAATMVHAKYQSNHMEEKQKELSCIAFFLDVCLITDISGGVLNNVINRDLKSVCFDKITCTMENS